MGNREEKYMTCLLLAVHSITPLTTERARRLTGHYLILDPG